MVSVTDLTRKSEPDRVSWIVECSMTFEKLNFLSRPRNVNFSLPIILEVDASDVRVGTVLSQADEKGLENHPGGIFLQEAITKGAKVFGYSGVPDFQAWSKGLFCLFVKFIVQTDPRALQ